MNTNVTGFSWFSHTLGESSLSIKKIKSSSSSFFVWIYDIKHNNFKY